MCVFEVGSGSEMLHEDENAVINLITENTK